MSDHFSGRSGGGLGGGLPNGVKLAAVALLIHQLMKHRQGEAAPQAESGGGLGGLLGGLFGGAIRAVPRRARPAGWAVVRAADWEASWAGCSVAVPAVGCSVASVGCWPGCAAMGSASRSIAGCSPAPTARLPLQELERGFDPQELDEAAQRAGTDRGTLLQELSAMLPQAVDRMTPQGRVPQQEADIGGGGLGGLISSLLGQGPEPPRHR